MEQSADKSFSSPRMTDDIFKEVSEDEMPKVLKALKLDWPKHFLLYQILTILEEYKKAGSKWEHTLYLYGNFETGVYLNKVYVKFPSGLNYLYLYVYTPNSDLTDLKKCLEQTQAIPWQKKGYLFQMIDSRFLKTIQEAYASKGMDCLVHNNTMFWFPPHKELHIHPLPDDVDIDFLDESHALEMDKNWPHRFPGSEYAHQEHLKKHFGMGLFRKADKKMLSSALSNYTGGVFVLHSDPEFRGKGYAGLVVQHMVRELRRRGRIPFCTVIIGNKPSEQVFKRVGFEPFTNAEYIFPKF